MDQLTARERQVVALVIACRQNKQIAWELSITIGTVKIHMHNIYRKLGVTSRMQLAWLARGVDANALEIG